MRVLLVNTSELAGGAAIAAGRLLRALNRNGIEAELLVRDKQTDNPRVVALPSSPMLRANFLLERLDVVRANGLRRDNLFAIDPATRGTDITRLPEFQRADVVHLHWVNQGMLSLRGLRRILATGKRIVWTLHDMWPLTGICHYADKCEGWLSGCGRCPLLHRPGPDDLSHRTYARKAAAYATGPMAFVACSDWLAALARRAPLLAGQRVESIPNPLDTSLFSPADRGEARRQLGLPQERRLVLFVAYKATDPHKGIDYLRRAMAMLAERDATWRDRVGVVAVGREASYLKDSFAVPVYPQEYVADTATMVRYYRAADVLAMPTLRDNLPNTVAEAMACGVPCVAFGVGGLPQMIDHGVNGYLARPQDAASLAEGLRALLGPGANAWGAAAREKAVKSYSEQAVAARYARVYCDE